MSGEYFPVINTGFTTRERKSGKQYTTVEVSAESLVHNLDPKQLGAPVAAAIAQAFRDGIERITQRASDATIRARQRARADSSPSLAQQQRYGGGRMGAMQPGQSDRLFNDSGRLAKSIVAKATSAGEWVVNVASNRLNDERFRIQLAQLVPEFGDARRLMDSIGVRRAIKDGAAAIIQKQSARITELKEERVRSIVSIGRGLLALVG